MSSMMLPRGLAMRPALALRSRRSIVVRAEAPVDSTPAAPKTPEWVPEQAGPVLKFLDSSDFKVEDSEVYQKYVKQVVENPYFVKSTGFKPLAETINGRAAMLGFVAAAGAEIFGSGSVLSQLSAAPQVVLVLMGLVVASSIIPIYKGTEGDYLSALRDTYAVPENVFTESNERVHGRLAMLGLGALILLELVAGRAIL